MCIMCRVLRGLERRPELLVPLRTDALGRTWLLRRQALAVGARLTGDGDVLALHRHVEGLSAGLYLLLLQVHGVRLVCVLALDVRIWEELWHVLGRRCILVVWVVLLLVLLLLLREAVELWWRWSVRRGKLVIGELGHVRWVCVLVIRGLLCVGAGAPCLLLLFLHLVEAAGRRAACAAVDLEHINPPLRALQVHLVFPLSILHALQSHCHVHVSQQMYRGRRSPCQTFVGKWSGTKLIVSIDAPLLAHVEAEPHTLSGSGTSSRVPDGALITITVSPSKDGMLEMSSYVTYASRTFSGSSANDRRLFCIVVENSSSSASMVAMSSTSARSADSSPSSLLALVETKKKMVWGICEPCAFQGSTGGLKLFVLLNRPACWH